MSIVLSCWNSSCATLNLWGDLDTKSFNSGFPGKTASKLRLKKLILARPISWTVLTHCFPFWRAIPAFCLFYWYVAFTMMGCYPGPDFGGFLVLKTFSDVMKPRISIGEAMCVYTDFHLPGKPYVENGTVYVCYLFLCHPSTVTGRDLLRLGWRGIWRLLLIYAMKNPIPSSIQIHSWVLQILWCQPLKNLFFKFGSNTLLLINEKGMMNKNFEKAACREQVLRAQLSVCLRFSFCLVLTGDSCQRVLKYSWVFRTTNNMFYCS